MPAGAPRGVPAPLAPPAGGAGFRFPVSSGIKLSLNDPRWGHRPEEGHKAQEGRRPGKNDNKNGNKNDGGDGPPDLDQLWRDFNQRLNRLFGKRGGSGGDGSFRPGARGVGAVAGLAAAIAAAIWLSSGAFVVPEGQVGIVTTFGQLSHKTGPGVSWRWPAPFQAHEVVNVAQVQTAEIGYRGNVRNKQPNEALMLTGDQNIVDLQFSVQYKIKDPVAWVFNNRDQVDTVRGAAETAVREVVGGSKMDYVLYDGRERVALEARGRIQDMFERYKLGAEVVAVTVQSAQPPEQVAAAFEDGVRAQEDRARLRSEADAYASDVILQARGRAARQLQDAQGYRATVENTAEGNAARFDKIVAEYAKAPAVTRDRMYIDTMQQILSSTSKVMIDAKTGTNQIYLPLDRLLAQSTANEAALGSRSGPVMMPAQPPAAGQPGQPAQQQAPGQAQAQGSQQVPQQAQPQVQQGQQGQPQQGQAQAPAQAQPAPAPEHGEARHRDLRSRDASRERESR
ncbi:FtsH protease activity modulator HflK [Massilia forsythiae]|uniref:Protein HflK n=2 Tax=Massilia forsythiae TaxID=2728020 RepID=A0A7Z2ZVA2_9BURK|nr:FtsH protease activity modulator HflK [Massilia forsythiae]